MTPATRRAIVVASGPTITDETEESLRERPVRDFTVLQQRHDTVIVDPGTAVRGPFSRLVAKRLGSAWVVAFRSVREAGRTRVIIAMADDVGAPIAVMKLLLFSRAPVVMVCQHMRSRKVRLFLGRLRLHRLIQLFFAASTAQRDLMLRTYMIPPDKMEIGYDPVDHRFFAPDPSVEVRRQVCSAGLAERDYLTLMRATKGLDVDVKIEANSAWYTQPLNFTADDVHDRVELCNDGTTKGLRAIYASSQIVVVPLNDVDVGAGHTTILEGMAMGKPVITSRIPFIGDYIDDGINGFLVPPCDVEALRDQITALLEQPELRRTIGEAARHAVETHFTLDQFEHRMARAIERYSPAAAD